MNAFLVMKQAIHTSFNMHLKWSKWHRLPYVRGTPCNEHFFSLLSSESVVECPRNCHGNGECVSGTCHCFPGFLGPDCSRGMRVRFSFLTPIQISHGNTSNSENYPDGQERPRPGVLLVPATSFLSEPRLKMWFSILLSCFVSQQPVQCCAVATGSTQRAGAFASAAGRARSVTCPRPNVLTRSVAVVGFASWALALATQATKEKIVKKVMPIFMEVCYSLWKKKQIIVVIFS